MTTSIYISNDSVQVAAGSPGKNKAAIRHWGKVPLPEGAVINGIILGDAAVKAAVTTLRKEYKIPMSNVCLVIDSNAVMTRRMTVPIQSEKRMRQLIGGEFSSAENAAELVYDYAVLSPRDPAGEGGVVLVSAVPRPFLESYVTLFAELGIKVKSIDLAVCSLIRLMRLPTLKRATCVVAVLDGNSVNAGLFVDGEYRFFNRSRLLAARGTMESAYEINRLISSIVQFNSSEKTGREIASIYLCGLDAAEEAIGGAEPALASAKSLSELSLMTMYGEFGQLEPDAEEAPAPAQAPATSLCAELSQGLGIPVEPFPVCAEISLRGQLKTQQQERGYALANAVYTVGGLLRR